MRIDLSCARVIAAAGMLTYSTCCLARETQAPASQPATQPTADDLKTPRDTMLAFDRLVPVGGEQIVPSFFLATNNDEKQVVASYAKVETEIAHVQVLVSQRFGKEMGLKFLHAIGDETHDDILAAKIEIKDDHADVKWADGHPPNHLVNVDGKWLLDVSADVRDANGSVKLIVTFEDKLQQVVHELGRNVSAGVYRSGDEVTSVAEKALKELVQ